MAEKTTPFVINDRRKFTADGELRPDAQLAKPEPTSAASVSPEMPAEHSNRTHSETIPFPSATPAAPVETATSTPPEPEETGEFAESEDQLPPAPSAEQSEQAARAYAATVDRLDTAIRASNPGADRIPDMSFDRFVQSLYMQTILQLGGGAEPGQQPQIDILGARQTIDMLAILSDKTNGNLQPNEDKLLQSALFEARMGFLEVTQALSRQAASRQPGIPGSPVGGPSIVR